MLVLRVPGLEEGVMFGGKSIVTIQSWPFVIPKSSEKVLLTCSRPAPQSITRLCFSTSDWLLLPGMMTVARAAALHRARRSLQCISSSRFASQGALPPPSGSDERPSVGHRIAQQLQSDPVFAQALFARLTPDQRMYLAHCLTDPNTESGAPKLSVPHTDTTTSKPAMPEPSESLTEQTEALSVLEPKVESTSEGGKFRDRFSGLTVHQAKLLFIRSFVPFIAFGASSNAILLLTGDAIDSTIGVAFGLSALCSAGLANAVSDTVGMLSTAPLERLTGWLGIPEVRIKAHQERAAKTLSSAGQILGMILGCLLGMFALFFIHERTCPIDAINVALSPAQRMQLTKVMQKMEYEEGDYIMKYGSPGECLHIIAHGEVDIMARDDKGAPVKVCTMGPGEVVGELEIIHGHNCIADVVAASHVVTRKFFREDVKRCMGPALEVFKDVADHESSYAWYRARRDAVAQGKR